MLERVYLAIGILALSLFALAQYHGWSVYGASETRDTSGVTRSAYHK